MTDLPTPTVNPTPYEQLITKLTTETKAGTRKWTTGNRTTLGKDITAHITVMNLTITDNGQLIQGAPTTNQEVQMHRELFRLVDDANHVVTKKSNDTYIKNLLEEMS